jgi:hypothetical protein
LRSLDEPNTLLAKVPKESMDVSLSSQELVQRWL